MSMNSSLRTARRLQRGATMVSVMLLTVSLLAVGVLVIRSSTRELDEANAAVARELREETGLPIHVVQVLALHILDQLPHKPGDGVVIMSPNHSRDGLQARHLGSTPATLTGDEFIVTTVQRTHHNGLHHPLGGDGIRQFLQGFRLEMHPRLVGATLDQIHIDDLQTCGTLLGRGCIGICGCGFRIG